jgi:hypothetical protein
MHVGRGKKGKTKKHAAFSQLECSSAPQEWLPKVATALSWVVDGAEGLQIWRVAASILFR